jgi:hypothetical protein
MSENKENGTSDLSEVTNRAAGKSRRVQSNGAHARSDSYRIAPDEDGYCDAPDDEPLEAEYFKSLISDKRKTAGHENGSEACQHVNCSILMCRVSDNDIWLDRHCDENQPRERRRAAAYHDKEVIPLI